MEALITAGKQLVTDKKATDIMALQVGQKGDPYHIYPVFTSGGGSFFGLTADGDPDPKVVTVDSPESIAAGQKLYDMGEKGVGALKRSIDDKTAIPLFTGGKTAFLVSGPWAIADIAKSGVKYDISHDPAVRRREAPPARSSASTASTSPARAPTRRSPRNSSPPSCRPSTSRSACTRQSLADRR